MTGLPAMLHIAIIFFWAANTSAAGISIPRSPRATMTPSVSFKISAKLLRPCLFSILAMIWMCWPSSPRTWRIDLISSPRRMNEAKTISTLFLTPNRRSALSFSERAGRSTSVLGRLTPFLDEILPLLRARTRIVFSSTI